MSEPLIQTCDLQFGYAGGRAVLRGVNLDVRPGERLALVGANGSGKTTLLHLLVGLLKPSAGRIVAFGRERRSEGDFWEVRARAGLLFEDPEDQLFCPTVAEDVAFGPLNLGRRPDEALAAARKALEALELDGYDDRITYRLSGGEKRLVSLACVLAMEPDVLLLDEPVAGLDDEMYGRLVEILARLPHAALVVSHDRRFLKQVAGRAMLLQGGRAHPFDLDRPISHRA